MSVFAWRIVKAKHAGTALTGSAAKTFGGRWNSPGVAAIYTAGSVSLAMLEMLVHIQSEELLSRYVAFEISFEESMVEEIDLTALPRNWRKSPPPTALQRIGDAWIAGETSSVLRVPSAVVATEWNYLLNPSHPDFGKIAIGPKQSLRWDRRLAGK